MWLVANQLTPLIWFRLPFIMQFLQVKYFHFCSVCFSDPSNKSMIRIFLFLCEQESTICDVFISGVFKKLSKQVSSCLLYLRPREQQNKKGEFRDKTDIFIFSSAKTKISTRISRTREKENTISQIYPPSYALIKSLQA